MIFLIAGPLSPWRESLESNGKVYAYIWFDVEDYVTPESNDVPLQAIKILKKYKVPVTMKLVAEKVRFMKEQKRKDVLSAVKDYVDVGYHTDTHSRHPIVFEYIRNKDVISGAKEIEKRERLGLSELRRTFGKTPSCFGHAGSQFAPHYYPYLKKAGIGVYMDATDLVNIDDSPYWYCGVLNFNNTDKNYVRFDRTFATPEGNSKLKERFREIHDRLAGSGGGAISILWHPHTGVNMEYWDTLNFSNGKNTAKGKYVHPEQYPQEVKDRALSDFESLVQFGLSFPDVQFISASDAKKIFRRKIEMTLGVSEIREIAGNISSEISFFRLGEEYISPAQAFCAMVNFAASFAKSGKIPKRTAMNEPLGPMAVFKTKSTIASTKVSNLLSAAEKTSRFIATKGYMPSSIKVGILELDPGDFLATLAGLVSKITSGEDISETIPVRKAKMILAEKYVDDSAIERACSWGILPKGFKAPKILEQAKLQTWTLVPAVPRN
jgi:hypothetical protein